MDTPVTPQERRWCWLYAAGLAFVTTMPYLLGYATQGADWRFSGFVFGVEDGNSYIAKMLAGASGAWLFRTPYTTFPQQGILAFVPYLLLGKLAAPPGIHEQLVALFHLFRLAGIPLVVLATYRFVAHFLGDIHWRRWATVLATAGEGLGWLLLLAGKPWWLGSLPLDFYSPETFGFLSIFGLPHLLFARAFLLLGLSSYLDARASRVKPWRAGAWLLGLGLVQPISLVSAWAVIAAHLALSLAKDMGQWRRQLWPQIVPAATPVLMSAPWVVYYGIITRTDTYMRLWTAQNRILSPALPHYLIAWGLVLIPALAGAWWALRRGSTDEWLLAAWVVILPVLAYAPTNLQRRLPEGSWVALAVLGAGCLGRLSWPSSRSRWAGTIILTASLISPTLLVAGGLSTALRPGPPAFQSTPEVSVFGWIAGHAERGDVVLTSFATGNALPAWASVRVVAGHGPESAQLDQLMPEIHDFFSGAMPNVERLAFLQSHDVRFVLIGPAELALGDADPSLGGALSLSYERDGYAIFVRDRATPAASGAGPESSEPPG